MARGGRRWRGESGTYRFALKIFGPAQLSPHHRATPTTAEDVAREEQLQSSLERVQRPDGSWYLVTRPAAASEPGAEPAPDAPSEDETRA